MAPKQEIAGSSHHRIPISGLAWSLYKSMALWRAVYGSSATEIPLGISHEEKFRVSISSQNDLSC